MADVLEGANDMVLSSHAAAGGPLDDLDEVVRVGCVMARGRFVVGTWVLRARVLPHVW